MAGILQAPVRLLEWIRSFLRHDSILKSSALKCNLPVIYSLHEVGDPLFGRRWIYVIDNRLRRFYKLTLLILFHVLRFGFEPPSLDVVYNFDPLRIGIVIRIPFREIAHSWISKTFSHRSLG